MTLKELLKEAHLKGELYAGNLETGHYAEDFDEYYRHHELDLNKFELCYNTFGGIMIVSVNELIKKEVEVIF